MNIELFSKSIYDNIRVSHMNATLDEVKDEEEVLEETEVSYENEISYT